MKAALKTYLAELIATYLIGRAWMEVVDLTAKYVRKTQPPREVVVARVEVAGLDLGDDLKLGVELEDQEIAQQ